MKTIEEFENVIIWIDENGRSFFTSRDGSTTLQAMRELYQEILILRSEAGNKIKRLESEDQAV